MTSLFVSETVLRVSVFLSHTVLQTVVTPLRGLLSQAQTGKGINDIFGTVRPPGPTALSEPGSGISRLLSFSIQMSVFIAGILLLGYLFWGAFLYITSEGDEEKAAKARNVITYAIIGIILLFAAIAVFSVVAVDILGIVKRDAAGNLIFELPSVSDPAKQTPPPAGQPTRPPGGGGGIPQIPI